MARRNFGCEKRGSEAVETVLVSIGLVLIAAVIIVLFVMLFGAIYNLVAKKESQGTQESFNLLVAKLEELDRNSGLKESAHAYYTQNGFHLLGFNSGAEGIEARDGNIKKPPECGAGKACVCLCDDAKCGGKIIDCNSGSDGKKAKFDNVKSFVVTSDGKTKLNQGKEFSSGSVSGEYLAIYGKWGGVGIGCKGFGVHCWKPGTVIYLTKKGDVVDITFEKPADFGKGNTVGGGQPEAIS